MGNNYYDIIIVGGGPAGLFCASKISNSYSIAILDKNNIPAQKLLLSAKGRGNITNININPQNDYVSDDIAFVINAFNTFGARDFIDLLDIEGIGIKEENNGRILLKSGKVKEFHEKLLNIVLNKGVQIEYNTELFYVKKSSNDTFEINTNNGTFTAKKVIIATGGPSFPKLGASDIAEEIAKIFNLKTTSFYPALVGFETQHDFSSLSGSSVIGKLNLLEGENIIYEETGPILFTHRGISGPVVFNSSLFLRKNGNKGKYKIRFYVSDKEITKRLLGFLGFRTNKLKEYIVSSNIMKVRGLDEAKVCGGGVKTENLNSDFECKNIPGLYFIGECVDVTGKTGGFNLQRCRTSAYICAEGINSDNI